MAALAFAVDAPTIDDATPQVGQPLSAQAGAGKLEWLRCDSDPCVTVVGEGNTYTPVDADVGHPLRARLTVDEEGSAVSDPTAAVAPQPPPPPPPNPPKVDSVTITGDPYVGNKITASAAYSGGMPTSGPTWQWSRCAASCVAVGSSASYNVKAADAGHLLKADVTVSNADGPSSGSATVTVPMPPRIISAPDIFPEAINVGTTATTTAEWDPTTGSPSWQWILCGGAIVGPSCQDLAGKTTRSYVVAAQDAGSWLGVRLTLKGKGPDAVSYSEGRFIAKPDEKPPTTSTSPFTSTGSTPDPPEVTAPTLLDPFPIVRIKGRTTRVGAQLTLLSVRAPRGTRIRVRCRSDYCPRSRLALNTRLHRLRVFERSLRAGVVIEVRVMHPKKIGKYTRFLIRRAAPPLRRDACLAPGSRKPTRCPGS
jgi:hypothetical protein